MESLYLAESSYTPEVNFNIEENKFIISGKSLPPDALDFYEPILNWVEKFFNSDQVPINMALEFKLDYYNTASSKQIAKLFLLIRDSLAKDLVTIWWYYYEDDYDMLDSGQQYEKLIGLNFKYIVMEE
jgi:hypothetical protein